VQQHPRIAAVEAEEPYRLRVVFANGVTRIYDCEPLLQEPAFEALRNPGFFKNVHADPHGHGVVWTDEVDLSESEIWEHGM
jgi:hypothetical protein